MATLGLSDANDHVEWYTPSHTHTAKMYSFRRLSDCEYKLLHIIIIFSTFCLALLLFSFPAKFLAIMTGRLF